TPELATASLVFKAFAPFRVQTGGVVFTAEKHDNYVLYLQDLPISQYIDVVIEMAVAEGQPTIWIVELYVPFAAAKESSVLLREQYFFPPVVPPKPPVISDVKAVLVEGEQPVAPPYDVDGSRPAVRVGQEFTFDITDYGPPEIWDTLPTVSIDGIPLPFESEEHPVSDKPGVRILHCRDRKSTRLNS